MSDRSCSTCKKLLGHQNLAMTQRYAHLSDDGLMKATAGQSNRVKKSLPLPLIEGRGPVLSLGGMRHHWQAGLPKATFIFCGIKSPALV